MAGNDDPRRVSDLDLTIDERRVPGDVCLLDLAGEVDIASSPKLRAAIDNVMDRGHFRLVVSLERVRHIDSTGLGVLVRGVKRARECGGNLTLLCTNPQLKKLLTITGIAKLIDVIGDLPKAV